MAWAFFEHHLLVEGGAAVGLAALRAGKLDLPAGPVVVVISGRNVDLSTLLERVRRVARGRR
jgi:threonine dehydratase